MFALEANLVEPKTTLLRLVDVTKQIEASATVARAYLQNSRIYNEEVEEKLRLVSDKRNKAQELFAGSAESTEKPLCQLIKVLMHAPFLEGKIRFLKSLVMKGAKTRNDAASLAEEQG